MSSCNVIGAGIQTKKSGRKGPQIPPKRRPCQEGRACAIPEQPLVGMLQLEVTGRDGDPNESFGETAEELPSLCSEVLGLCSSRVLIAGFTAKCWQRRLLGKQLLNMQITVEQRLYLFCKYSTCRILRYETHERLRGKKALDHPYFNSLRIANGRLPNGYPLPPLYYP